MERLAAMRCDLIGALVGIRAVVYVYPDGGPMGIFHYIYVRIVRPTKGLILRDLEGSNIASYLEDNKLH